MDERNDRAGLMSYGFKRSRVVSMLKGLYRNADGRSAAPGSPVDPDWRGVIHLKDWTMFRSCGLYPFEVREIEVGLLRVQHRSEWAFDHFLNDDPTFGPRSILGSPFFDAARQIREHGETWVLNNYRQTKYYAMFRHFDSHSYMRNWATGGDMHVSYSDKAILTKLKGLSATMSTIEARCYLGEGFRDRPIIVLDTPYENLKFGAQHPTPPYEIWSGHHRAASLAALETKIVKVVVLVSAPSDDGG